MTLAYNIEPANIDIVITQGDDIYMSFDVELNDISYDLTGQQIDIYIKRKDGLLIAHWTTEGVSPEITIAASIFNIIASSLNEVGHFDYDVQKIDGVSKNTFMYGTIHCKKEITTI